MNKMVAIGSLLVLGLVSFVAGRYSTGTSYANPKDSKRVLYYVDPMHPSYRSDKPGIAPDCGMALVPVYEGEDRAASRPLPAGGVSISRTSSLKS
jgi:Cu(I)/Ag(I) efflux system membrane fusion protein